MGLNAVGIALLAVHAAALGEAAFLAVNVLTGGFWVLVAGVKAAEAWPDGNGLRRPR